MRQNLRRRIGMTLFGAVGLYCVAAGILGTCKKMNPAPPNFPQRLPNGMTTEDMHEMRYQVFMHDRALRRKQKGLKP